MLHVVQFEPNISTQGNLFPRRTGSFNWQWVFGNCSDNTQGIFSFQSLHTRLSLLLPTV